MNDEQIMKLINFGALNYKIETIVVLLDIENQLQFSREFNDPNSIIHKSYKKGKLKAEYLIDLKVLQMAQGGDLKAIELMNKKRN
jgi:hypothetical protein